MTDITGEGDIGLGTPDVRGGIRPENDPDDHTETEPSDDEPKVEQQDEPTDEPGGEA